MYKKIFIIFFLLMVQIFAQQNQNSNFDFSPMKTFWKIHSLLINDMEPSDNLWNELFNHKGYNILTTQEYNREFFKSNFRLAFKPSMKDELRRELSNPSKRTYLTHYLEVTKRKGQLIQRQKELMQSRFNRSAFQAASEYLPKLKHKTINYPPVTFLIFANDGRGSSPIILDLLATITWDFIQFLSHEYHHWYRRHELKFNEQEIVMSDRYLWNALSSLEAEGIADLVDKKNWFDRSYNTTSSYAQQFLSFVRKTPSVIKSMNILLEEISDEPKKILLNGKKIYSMLPFGGHPNGYFFAYIILEKMGKNEIMNCFANPPQLLISYNKSARLSNGKYPLFSQKAISVIKKMQKKYIHN